MKKAKKKAKKAGKKPTVLETVRNVDIGYVLSKKEDQLMQTLVDPASRLLPVLELCRRAKVSKDTYYKAFEKREFCAFYRQATGDLFKRASAPLANALLREALRGSAPHLKIALELSGIYDPKFQVAVSGSVDVTIEDEKTFVAWLCSSQPTGKQGNVEDRVITEDPRGLPVAEALPAPGSQANPFDE